MGLFGRNREPQAAPPLAAEREVIVVGTEHYTDMRRWQIGDVAGITVEAEPTNPHDKNAVMVCANGHRVGYLSAARAKTYRPLLSGRHPVHAKVRKASLNTPELALYVLLPRVGGSRTASRRRQSGPAK